MARASSYNPSTYYQQQSKSTYKPSTYNAPSKSSYNPSEYYKQKDLAAQARYVAPKSTYVAPKPVSTYTPAPSTYTPPAYKAPVSTYTAPKPVVSTYNPSEYYKQKDLEAQARYVAPSSSTYTSSSSTYTSTSYTTPVSMYTAPSTSVSTYNPSEYYKQKDLEAQARYVAPKPAYVAPNTTVSTYNPSEYYKQKDLEAQARANNSISTSVTKKAEPAATSSATPRINSAEDAKTYYNTLNGTSGSTNSNSGNVKTAANNVSSNISTTPNGTGKTNVTVTQQVKDNAAAVSNKVTTTTPKPQTTPKIVPGAPTEYYDNIAGKVASDNKQATTSSPKTVNVKSTYNPSEYYKQKDLETQAKYVAPKAISAESKVTKPYNPGEYYKQKDLTAQTRAKTLLGSNIPKLSANTPVKNLGINFDSNGKPIINSAEEAKVYMDSITLNRMISSLKTVTPTDHNPKTSNILSENTNTPYNPGEYYKQKDLEAQKRMKDLKPTTIEEKAAHKAGLSTTTSGTPRINGAGDAEAYYEALGELEKLEDNKIIHLELPSGNAGGALTRASLDRAITASWNITSTQNKIASHFGDTIYEDENGYARVKDTGLESDPYLIALAPYYRNAAINANIGDNQGYGAIFKVSFEDKHTIYATLGDAKGENASTEGFDDKQMYHKVYDKDGKSVPESNNLLEFLWATDWNHLPQCDRNMGAADSVTNKSKIAEISLLKDTEIVW